MNLRKRNDTIMYELKPLVPKYDIKIPTCMYSLKIVDFAEHSREFTDSQTSNGMTVCGAVCNDEHAFLKNATTTTSCVLNLDDLGQQIQKILKESNDTTLVLQRQEKLLKQLHELKGQLAEIRSSLGILNKPSPQKPHLITEMSQKNESQQLEEQPLPDLVINAHPKFIPYALLALKNLWKENFHLKVRTFTHSSLSEIGSEAEEFQRKLCEDSDDGLKKPKISVTLIWMDCAQTEMRTSSTMFAPIYGEVNIVRYLSRVGPLDFRYEDSQFCNEIDIVLDICYQLLRCKTPKSKSDFIRSLSNRLQKKEFFFGDRISIADIGVYSSLKRLYGFASAKDLTPVLTEWQKRIETLVQI